MGDATHYPDLMYKKIKRFDKFKQMTKQEQMIAEKKRQIEQKLEEHKRRKIEKTLELLYQNAEGKILKNENINNLIFQKANLKNCSSFSSSSRNLDQNKDIKINNEEAKDNKKSPEKKINHMKRILKNSKLEKNNPKNLSTKEEFSKVKNNHTGSLSLLYSVSGDLKNKEEEDSTSKANAGPSIPIKINLLSPLKTPINCQNKFEENPTQTFTNVSPFVNLDMVEGIPSETKPKDKEKEIRKSRWNSGNNPELIQYAPFTYGSLDFSEKEWQKVEENYKIKTLFLNIVRKKEEREKLRALGKYKHEYDSDEDIEGGTWEHHLRSQEMEETKQWANELNKHGKGKHHIGDFLPAEELTRFLEKYSALKEGRPPDFSDYKEFQLNDNNIGFQMLKKMGWKEGQGLGREENGILQPVNKADKKSEMHIDRNDDQYDAYRKRMMLSYRFRPNPLNNPRRPYY